jgi:hypothetical protein
VRPFHDKVGMNDPWKKLLEALSDTRAIAEWRLDSHVNFLMAMPEHGRRGRDEVEGTTVRYAEIHELIFRSDQALGAFRWKNNLGLLLQRAASCPGVTVDSHPTELRLSRAERE